MAEGLTTVTADGRVIPRITVRPRATTVQPQAQPEASLDELPDFVDKAAPAAGHSQSLDSLPDFVDTAMPAAPERQTGFGEAAAAGVRSGLTFGFDPALQGLQSAAQAPGGGMGSQVAGGVGRLLDVPGLSQIGELLGLPPNHELVQGIGRIIADKITGSDEASKAYEQGRERGVQTEELSRSQHPGAFYPGMIAGSLVVPVPGAGAAGGIGGNVARMAGQGAVMGAVQGVGEGVSRAESVPQIASRATTGGATGAGVGGAFGAVLPRALAAVTTRGQRAAQTASDLGASIPKGLASDRPALNTMAASLRSFPIFGHRVASQVERTQQAAGERIGGIATDLTGGPTDRAAIDTLIRPGLEAAISDNKAVADRLYKEVRGSIDPNARFTMPRTDRVLTQIMQARHVAGHENPAEGLAQFRNVASGTTFEGAQRARVDARDAGSGAVPHPGFNKADFDKIERAMTADLRGIVHGAAYGGAAEKRAAVEAFNRAEANFGPIADLNKRLNEIANARGEGAIATLLSAATEKSGDVRLLAQLRRTMAPDDFNQISGLLLHEMGFMPATGEFSLAKFATEFSKMSPRARGILYEPQHLRDIENIAEMGQHIKGALKMANVSHTAAPIIILDLAKDVVVGGIALAHGLVAPAAVATGAAASAPGIVFAHWLSSPAQAAAISRWTTAYRAVTLGQPTPARIAAFKIATRNLAHNLNVPVENVMRSITQHVPGRADVSGEEDQNE